MITSEVTGIPLSHEARRTCIIDEGKKGSRLARLYVPQVPMKANNGQCLEKIRFYIAHVSSPLDHSKRSTLYQLHDRPVHSSANSTSLGSILREDYSHISTTVYSQVLI